MEKQNMKVSECARIMGKSDQFVRLGIQRKEFPFGTAVKVSGNRYNYHIAPKAFWDYMGGEPDEDQSNK